MSGILDDQTIDFPCECGVTTPKSIGWLKSNNQFICECGTLTNLNTGNFVKKVSKVERAIDDLKETIDRINKKK